MTTQFFNRMRWGGAKTWILIVLILLAAVLVPVGLYYVGTLSFSNGTTGANLSTPDTGIVTNAAPAAAAPAKAASAKAATAVVNTPITAGSKTMDLLVIDRKTKEPLAGLRVSINRPRFNGTTGADGHVSVPVPDTENPNFNVRVSGKGYVAQRLMWAPYNQSYQGPVPASITLAMGKPTKISGKVVDDAGNPVEGANVALDFTEDLSNGHAEVDYNWNNPAHPIKTDAEGKWSYGAAPENCEQIGIVAWSLNYVTGTFYYPQPYSPVSAFYDGTAVYTLHRGIAVTVKVLGPDGSPVAGATVSTGQNRFSSNSIPAQKTDSSGQVVHHFTAGESASVVAEAPGFAPAMKQFGVGQADQSVTIQLSKGQTITGKVLDANGNPVRAAYINIQDWNGLNGVLQPRIQTDGDGNFKWAGAPDGPVQVSVDARGLRGVQDQTISAGQPNVIHLGKTSRISGTVVDGATGQPIEKFSLTMGIMWAGQQQVTWQPGWDFAQNSIQPGGRFSFENTWPYPGIAVKIEAKGYKPAESRVVTSGEGDATLAIKMEVGKDLIFTVQTADGKPVANAQVGIADAGEQLFVQDGRQFGNGRGAQAQTAADGKVDLPPRDAGKFKVAAISDEGYGTADQDEIAKTGIVTISAWGKIQGRMMVGSKPAANQQVNISSLDDNQGPFDQQEPRIYVAINAQTDSGGNFSVDRVPAGRWNLGRMIPLSANSSTTAVLGMTEVKAGETVTVSLGGTGRPVGGRAVLPSWFQTHLDWQYGFCQVNTWNTDMGMMPPMPLLVRMLSQERQQEWVRNWMKSDEGKAWQEKRIKAMANNRNIPFTIGSDGTFRIEDVPAGTYQLMINIQQTGGDNRFGGQQVGMGQLQFTVPDMPGGRSDQALLIEPVEVVRFGHYDVGDEVADLDLMTTDGKSMKLSDLKGKYVLLWFGMANNVSSLEQPLKKVYGEYGHDDRLVMLNVTPEFVQKGGTPGKIGNDPWTQAGMVASNLAFQIMNTNFGQGHVFLIGRDGKVVGKDLTADGIEGAVKGVLGEAEVPATVGATTGPSTMP